MTSPLPPNRTGGFPASGSPVSGAPSERWPLGLGLRLRRLARARRNRHFLPPLIPLSRVANMRSVHTAASVHPQRGGISLPCLAFGTPGSCICSCVSFTLPPSCPPSLHGHYPLHRYYEDSDSCPAPLSTRTGILGSWALRFQSFRLHPPDAPLLRRCSCSGQAWPPIRFAGYRRFFGLRSLVAVSSVASGRIEFVA